MNATGVLSYCLQAAWTTCRQLAMLLLPFAVPGILMQLLTNAFRNRLSTKLFLYLTAPGVILHELSHALACVIFRHRITNISLFSPNASNGTLGSVSHAYIPASPWQRIGNFFIGVAPVIGGTITIFILAFLLIPEAFNGIHPANPADSLILQLKANIIVAFNCFKGLFSTTIWTRWQSWLWLLLTIIVASHVTLSPPDIKGAMDGLLALIITLFTLNLASAWAYNPTTLLNQIWARCISPAFTILLVTDCFIATIAIPIIILKPLAK